MSAQLHSCLFHRLQYWLQENSLHQRIRDTKIYMIHKWQFDANVPSLQKMERRQEESLVKVWSPIILSPQVHSGTEVLHRCDQNVDNGDTADIGDWSSGLEQSRPCVIQIGHQPSIAHYSSGVGMMPINIHLSPAAPVDGHYRCTNDAQGNTHLSTSPQ